MRLHVLGSSGTWPAPGRPCSGYLVEQSGTRVLLDVGPGVFAALSRRLAAQDLDAIVVSHIHPDHCIDLYPMYHYLRWGPGASSTVTLYLPAGAAEHFAAFARADEPGHPFFATFDMRTMAPGDETSVGSLRLRFGAAVHPVPTLACRVESEGRSLAYTADTGPGEALASLAAGVDVLLAEATLQGEGSDETRELHMTAAEAGALGRAAGAGRLILTHLPPTLDPVTSTEQAEAAFGRRVEVAVPGMEVKV